MKKPKVALVHDYLIQYGGAERALAAISELYPDAPIYTGIYDPKNFPDEINKHKVISVNNFFLKNFTKYFTWLMPFVFESFDLRDYDLIISNGTAWPKGVLTKPTQLHISYIQTPPRFLYGYSVESTKRNAWYFKIPVMVIDYLLRIWDYSAAQRPNYLLSNSKEISQRVQKFYNRESTIMYPPVDIKFDKNLEKPKDIKTPYYVAIGRLVAYKNFDLLIEAFNNLDLNLVIIGTGSEENKLRKMAKSNIKLVGKVSDNEKHALIEYSQGVIDPVKDEDFGIVPIEAQSHGKPVLAHKSGGHLETVKEGVTGMFFEDLDPAGLATKIKEFNKVIENGKFDSNLLKKGVQEFSKENFQKEFKAFVDEKWEEFCKKNA